MGIKYFNRENKYTFNIHGEMPLPLKLALLYFLFIILLHIIIFLAVDLNIPDTKKTYLTFYLIAFDFLCIGVYYFVTQYLKRKKYIIALMYLHSTLFGTGFKVIFMFLPMYIAVFFLHPELYVNISYMLLFLFFIAIGYVIMIDDDKFFNDSLLIHKENKKSESHVLNIGDLFKNPILKYIAYVLFLFFIFLMFKSSQKRHSNEELYYVLYAVSMGTCYILYSEICYLLLIIKIETKRLIRICKRDNKNSKIK